MMRCRCSVCGGDGCGRGGVCEFVFVGGKVWDVQYEVG